MAKASKIIDDGPVSEPITETVTYIPGDGDPSSVKWGGVTFQANVPKELTGREDGTASEKMHLHLIERARDNKHFVVGGAKPKRDAMTRPRTADEYRAYFVNWLKDPAIQHAEQLITRFAQDRELQASCEVGSDDYSYIATLLMPKLHELSRADELTEGQVAQIWINHGFNQLPW